MLGCQRDFSGLQRNERIMNQKKREKGTSNIVKKRERRERRRDREEIEEIEETGKKRKKERRRGIPSIVCNCLSTLHTLKAYSLHTKKII